MADNEKLEKLLGKINIPRFENDSHYKSLELKLQMEIQKIEAEKNEKTGSLAVFKKYAMAASFSTILAVMTIMLVFIIATPKKLDFVLVGKTGKAVFKSANQDEFKPVGKSFSPGKNYIIRTEAGSDISFILGTGYRIKLDELTQIALTDSVRKGEDENCDLYIGEGTVKFSIKRPTKDSIFRVDTDFSSFMIKGTKFTVKVVKNKSVQLLVSEGRVAAVNHYSELDKLAGKVGLDSEISGKLRELTNDEIFVDKGNSLLINKDDIEMINRQIRDTVYALLNNIRPNEEVKKSIIENLDSIIKKKIGIIHPQKQEENKSLESDSKAQEKARAISVRKLQLNAGINLEEKNTAVTSDGGLLYIASDSNNAVYCIDIAGERIKWKFCDKDLKSVTTPVIPYNGYEFFGSPDYLYILDEAGNIKFKKQVNGGPNYWTHTLVIDGAMYIPSSGTIYEYDGDKLTGLENLPESKGTLYISRSQNKIYINDLNAKKIKEYDLRKKAVSRESAELAERAFMNPLITDKYVFIIDMSGISYRFDRKSPDSRPLTLNIKTGVMSNIVMKGDAVYFVAADGYFCRINAGSFDKCERIIRVDNGDDKDKFLTKRLLETGNELYYCGENGNLFRYNCQTGKPELIKIADNIRLTGSPVLINNRIYVVDD